eukprot:scaffold649_cov347-Pavlova_lutheri.AAC.5
MHGLFLSSFGILRRDVPSSLPSESKHALGDFVPGRMLWSRQSVGLCVGVDPIRPGPTGGCRR